MNGPRLVGERVSLTPLAADATDLILEWRNSRDSLLGVYHQPQLTRQSHEAWYKRYVKNDDDVRWMINAPSLGAVGVCGLTDRKALEHTAYLAVMLGDARARGKGLAREALTLMLDYGFGPWGLRRVTVEVFDNNPDALRLYERLGFQQEGRMLDGHYDPVSEKLVDVIIMGLLGGGWKERRRCSR